MLGSFEQFRTVLVSSSSASSYVVHSLGHLFRINLYVCTHTNTHRNTQFFIEADTNVNRFYTVFGRFVQSGSFGNYRVLTVLQILTGLGIPLFWAVL